MKKSLLFIFSITILAMALTSVGTDQTDVSTEVFASETIGEPLVFPWQPSWLAAETTSAMSTSEFVPSTSFGVCNQGARCTYKTDPACGPEGFCNLPSNCCMCY